MKLIIIYVQFIISDTRNFNNSCSLIWETESCKTEVCHVITTAERISQFANSQSFTILIIDWLIEAIYQTKKQNIHWFSFPQQFEDITLEFLCEF